jgi:hypothetical protein
MLEWVRTFQQTELNTLPTGVNINGCECFIPIYIYIYVYVTNVNE